MELGGPVQLDTSELKSRSAHIKIQVVGCVSLIIFLSVTASYSRDSLITASLETKCTVKLMHNDTYTHTHWGTQRLHTASDWSAYRHAVDRRRSSAAFTIWQSLSRGRIFNPGVDFNYAILVPQFRFKITRLRWTRAAKTWKAGKTEILSGLIFSSFTTATGVISVKQMSSWDIYLFKKGSLASIPTESKDHNYRRTTHRQDQRHEENNSGLSVHHIFSQLVDSGWQAGSRTDRI